MWAVLQKELRDSLRDRRSLASALIFPLIGPVLMAVMLSQTTAQLRDSGVELPVAGREHAPGLVSHLEEHGVTIVAAPEDPLAAVEDGDAAMVLVVPPAFAEDYQASRPATVMLISDPSRTDQLAKTGRVRRIIQARGAEIGSLRLFARGVSADLPNAIVVQDVDVSTPSQRAGIFFETVLMFVLIAAFVGGMYSATDATAGERERGSLEPLLLTTMPRRRIVIGKWLATVVFSGGTVLLTLASTWLALGQLDTSELGIELSMSPAQLVAIALVTLPLAALATALQVLIGLFAKSVKEAQTYLSFMVFLPMIPSLASIFGAGEMPLWRKVIPIVGQQALLTGVMRGDPLDLEAAGLLLATTAVVVVACLAGATNLLRRERTIFGP